MASPGNYQINPDFWSQFQPGSPTTMPVPISSSAPSAPSATPPYYQPGPGGIFTPDPNNPMPTPPGGFPVDPDMGTVTNGPGPYGGLPPAVGVPTPPQSPMPNVPVGSSPSGPSAPGNFSSGMSAQDVQQLVNAYVSAAGLPNTDNGQYWVNAWNQWGSKDPNYFRTKLLNGISQNGGQMAVFGPPNPSAPGGWGPGTGGWSGGGTGGGTGGGGGMAGDGGNTFAGGSYQLPPGASFPPYQAPNFTAPAPFVAPTDVTMANDPGFQFRLAEGQRALENSAAAKGSILSGGTLKALDRYAQDYASGEYGNVFNRALQGYNTNTANYWLPQELNAQYGLAGYQTNVATQRNAQLDYWNRLNTLYQGGQTAAGDIYKTPPGF